MHRRNTPTHNCTHRHAFDITEEDEKELTAFFLFINQTVEKKRSLTFSMLVKNSATAALQAEQKRTPLSLTSCFEYPWLVEYLRRSNKLLQNNNLGGAFHMAIIIITFSNSFLFLFKTPDYEWFL